MKTTHFILRYVPNAMLNFASCDQSMCGICGVLSNGTTISPNTNDFELNDNALCKSNFNLMPLTSNITVV